VLAALTKSIVPQMLFPHSGRHGFDNITPDTTVPTPNKEVRPSTMRNITVSVPDKSADVLGNCVDFYP
jgi:hypothetical protein